MYNPAKLGFPVVAALITMGVGPASAQTAAVVLGRVCAPFVADLDVRGAAERARTLGFGGQMDADSGGFTYWSADRTYEVRAWRNSDEYEPAAGCQLMTSELSLEQLNAEANIVLRAAGYVPGQSTPRRAFWRGPNADTWAESEQFLSQSPKITLRFEFEM